MKTLISSALFLAIATGASAQVVPSVQESGDIFADIVRFNQPSGPTTLSSPFNMGFVNNPTAPILPTAISSVNNGSSGSPSYLADVFLGVETNDDMSLESAIGVNISGLIRVALNQYTLAPYAITMVATDVIPCIETKIPKGTYTFQATATPNGSTSTPGSFEFATQTAGIWTVQFNLALPKAEGATRTLTFAHDTRVRWMLINQSGQTASAIITAKYYNSGG